jgi:hypothetical protein
MPSVWDHIRGLFGGRSERRKIEALMERRARLTAKRELIYSEIQRLERRERELLEQGRESESNAQKRRLAAQLAGLRKDLERRNTAAGVLSRHIDILSAHIHNLELIVSSDEARAPDTTELNETALRVDEILDKLKEDSDLVRGIQSDHSEELISVEEREILEEFERGRDAELAKLRLDEVAPESPARPREEEARRLEKPEPVRPEPARDGRDNVRERAEREAAAAEPAEPAAKRDETNRLTVAE